MVFTSTAPDLDKFRPMLSAKFNLDGDVDAQLAKLDFPLFASPKLDGIRVVCHPTLGPVTRTLKPVRNNYIRELLGDPRFHYLDGEVVVGDHESPNYSFQATESGVMSAAGEPNFTYIVFDYFKDPSLSFKHRYMTYLDNGQFEAPFTTALYQLLHSEPQQVLNYEEDMLKRGYEGLMLRHQYGGYKFGRSTLKQQGLIKLKRFEDAEAVITGFVELSRNRNEPTKDAFGLQSRSDHKAGMEPAGTLGAIIVRGVGGEWDGVTFNVGSGFDSSTRDLFWATRHSLVDSVITYTYQKCGSKDAPRLPIYKGLRRD